MSLFTQVASGLVWVLYGSFFEWYWHKYWMHQPRFPKQAFKGHTLTHHVLYKGGDDFFVPEHKHADHVLLKPYALPGLILSHLPIMLLIDRYLVHHTAIGALTATLLYFVTYEYMHWNMHVPRDHWVERFGWFQFLRQHHHLHHRYMQKNFCVLFPLADWVMGTMVTEKSLVEQRAARESAIDRGEYGQERKKRRRVNMRRAGSKGMPRVRLTRFANMRLAKLEKMATLARKSDVRRGRGKVRKPREKHDLRELLTTFTHRKHR